MLSYTAGNGGEVPDDQAAPLGGENVGVIEVVVLRCYASPSPVKAGSSTATGSDVSDISNVDEKDEPLLQGAMFDGGNDEKPKHSRKSSRRLSGLFPLSFAGTSEMSSSSTLRERSPPHHRQRKGEKIEIRDSNVHIYNSPPRSSQHARLTSESSELTSSARTELKHRHHSHGYQAHESSSSRVRRPSPRAHMASKRALSPSRLQLADIPRLRGGAPNNSDSLEEGQNGGTAHKSNPELKGVNAWTSFANNANSDAGNNHGWGNGGQSGGGWNSNNNSKIGNDTWSNGNNGKQSTSVWGAQNDQNSDQGMNQTNNGIQAWGKPNGSDQHAKQDAWNWSGNYDKGSNTGGKGLFGNVGETKLGANDTSSFQSALKPFKWDPIPPMPEPPSLRADDASGFKGKSPNSEMYVPLWDAEIPPMPKLPSLAASENSSKQKTAGTKPLKSALRRGSTEHKPRSSLFGSVGGAAKTLPGSWSPPGSPKKETKSSSTPTPLSDDQGEKQPASTPVPPVSTPPASSKPAPQFFSSPPHIGAYIPPLQARIKPYWAEWNHAPTTTFDKDNPVYTLPSEIAARENLTHQVRPVKGAAYRHKCERPQYLDTHDEPYALFVFKYREQSVIEGMVGRKLDVPTETEEQQRERLKRMTKDEIVEEVLKQRREGVILPTETTTLESGKDAANTHSASAPAWDSLKAWAADNIPAQANDAGDSWGKNPKGAATTWTADTSAKVSDQKKDTNKTQADNFGNNQSGGNDWKNDETKNDSWGNADDNGNGNDKWGSNDDANGNGSSNSSQNKHHAADGNGNWGATTDADQNNNWNDKPDDSGSNNDAWGSNGKDDWKAADQDGGNGGGNGGEDDWGATGDDNGTGTKSDPWENDQVKDSTDNTNDWNTANDSNGAFMSGGLNDSNDNGENWRDGDDDKNDAWDSGNNETSGKWDTNNNSDGWDTGNNNDSNTWDAGNKNGSGGGDHGQRGNQTSGNSGGGGEGW